MAKIKDSTKETLKQYLKKVGKFCSVDKAVLFGSYASGNAKKHSDIDIAIFSKKINDNNRLKMMSKMILAGNRLNVDIQPVAFSEKDYFQNDSDFIRMEVKKKGIVLV